MKYTEYTYLKYLTYLNLIPGQNAYQPETFYVIASILNKNNYK